MTPMASGRVKSRAPGRQIEFRKNAVPTVTASGVLWDATIGALNSARPRRQRTLRELR
jgi:hypothetical protein